MARVNKYLYEIIVQSHCAGQGWSDECGASDWKEAKADARSYRENCPGLPIRIIKRRVSNPAYKGA